MLFYRAAVDLSRPTLNYVAGIVRRHRRAIRSRWRLLNPGQQALLVLVHLRKGETFVEVASLDEAKGLTTLDPEGLNGTNRLKLFVFGSDTSGQARLVALLDNLGKGASGAAVQNLNIALGLKEDAGL